MARKKHPERLRRTFEDVLRTYFPRWARGPEWSIRTGTVSPYSHKQGHCLPPRRSILVREDLAAGGGARLEVLVIHECCHAVTTQGHGATWFKRMQVAADRADDVGAAEVAEALREQVKNYVEYHPGGPDRWNMNRIEDWAGDILIDLPDATNYDLLRFLCNELCESMRGLRKSWPRINVAFEKARKCAQEEAARREEWKRRRGKGAKA